MTAVATQTTGQVSLSLRYLRDAVERLFPVIAGAPAGTPWMSAVELAIEPGSLRLRAASTAMEMWVTLPCDGAAHACLSLPARPFHEILRTLDGELVLTPKEEAIGLKAGQFKTMLKTCEGPPAVTPASEAAAAADITLEGPCWRTMLRRASSCVNARESRQALQGVLLEAEPNTIRLIGTDGFRLVGTWTEGMAVGDGEVPARTAILPIPAIRAWLGVLEHEEVEWSTVTVRPSEARIVVGGWQIRTLYQPGPFPNWKQLVSGLDQTGDVLRVPRREGLEAIRRVALACSDPHGSIQTHWLPNVLHLEARSEMGEALEDVPVTYAGERHEVHFNPDYLLEAMHLFESEEVYWRQATAVTPMLFSAPNEQVLSVLMPTGGNKK